MDKLSRAHKQKLTETVAALDPDGQIVSVAPNVDFTGGIVRWNPDSGIVLGEKSYRLTDEEYIRAYLVVRLIRQLRYPPEAIEIEKGYTIGRPTGKSAQ